MFDQLIVFSHLRWSSVYQRPQHLLTRMASRHPVIFFEEPVHDKDCDPFLELSTPEQGVLVCTPHTPSATVGYHDEQLPWLSFLLKKLIQDHKVENYIAWLYTPMALPLAQNLNPSLIVYDCMDELSGFMEAPKQLVQRESELLKVANLVFTGGPSLYQAKKDHNPNVHCFPSSVDRSHFSQACDPKIEHQSQKHLPKPRLGYFGVLDERLDLALLHAMASVHPEWQIIMVGPVVKIAPDTLPRYPNIHYFGQQKYADLPAYLTGWDVCLIPFSLNKATRFISPTKTLEYMAAEKPIVSTPITDVVGPYQDIVFIGEGIENFISACEKALAMPPTQHETMVAAMREVLENTSWDATVEAMDALIANAIAKTSDRGLRDVEISSDSLQRGSGLNKTPIYG